MNGGGSGVKIMTKYSPPVDQAVDAMADPAYSCVSTSEMEGGVSEEDGGRAAARATKKPTSPPGTAPESAQGSQSDEVTPERPPRRGKPHGVNGGTRSNSDTDGATAKRGDTLKANHSSVGVSKSDYVVVSEPEPRRKEPHHESGASKSGAHSRQRRPSGAGVGSTSPKKKTAVGNVGETAVSKNVVCQPREGQWKILYVYNFLTQFVLFLPICSASGIRTRVQSQIRPRIQVSRKYDRIRGCSSCAIVTAALVILITHPRRDGRRWRRRGGHFRRGSRGFG